VVGLEPPMNEYQVTVTIIIRNYSLDKPMTPPETISYKIYTKSANLSPFLCV
jgi:hypothetical protein